MFIIFVLFLLPVDVDLHIAISAPDNGITSLSSLLLSSPHSLVYLFPCRDVKLIKGQDDSLQVLTVLHSVDEVSAHDMGLNGTAKFMVIYLEMS